MPKNKKIFLDFDDEEPLKIGLIQLAKNIKVSEFFFKINNINNSPFVRVNDFTITKKKQQFSFQQFKNDFNNTGYPYHIISNKSFEQKIKENRDSLFDESYAVQYLIENQRNIDFIIKTNDIYPDFSLILYPENSIFQIQEIEITTQSILYQYLLDNE